MSAEEAGKRTVQETSFEDADADSSKKHHADEAPSWALELLRGQDVAATGRLELLRGQNEIRGSIAELNAAFQDLKADVNKQGDQICELDSKVAINEDRLERMERKVQEVEDANEKLRTEYVDLEGELDDVRDELSKCNGRLNKQIDGGLRDHIVFQGIPKDINERSWDTEHTTRLLAEWLAANLDKDYHHFDMAIERAHRGTSNPEKTGPPPIHCKLRWRVANQIRDTFIKKGHKIGNVTIKGMCSESTQERINAAMIYRRQLRNEEGGKTLKLKVDYPARLMVKAPGENKYSLKKAF
jgi:hypothetical protein